jgi:diguanylate cyclase (GGDEF)-like protein/PAS domain S-box-containing protein
MEKHSDEQLQQHEQLTKQELALIFESIPANMFFKDTQGRYQLASQVCSMISGGNADFSLIGKTDAEIQPDKALGQRYLEEDLQVIATGEAMRYVQEMKFFGKSYHYEIAKQPVRNADGEIIGLTGIVNDVTERVELQEKTRLFSVTDCMTGIFNRSYYEAHPQKLKPEQLPMAVIIADSDGLKYINDHYGHKEGDYLIISTVSNIQRYLLDGAEMIRLGGDEFLILLPRCSEEACRDFIDAVQSSERSICIQDFTLSTSFGYEIAYNTERTLGELVELADKRMYGEKKYRHCRW